MKFLRAHLAEDVSLADLAYLTELSPHHFCRAFKVSTGWPPQVWFRRMCLEQAQAVVLGTNRPLALVATEHGFSSQQHFTTAFRRELGISPGALRRDRS